MSQPDRAQLVAGEAQRPAGGSAAALVAARASWEQERQRLLAMIVQQQRVAQTGLITAGLVHEVNNHLMLMQGMAWTAQRSTDPTTWRSALQQVEGSCNDLSETMKAILAFAGRREDSNLVTFRASDAVKEALRLLRPLALSKGISMDHIVHADGVFLGEQRLLVQALVNLVSNAIRACGDRTGRVRMRTLRVREGSCRIEVEDDGPGIPERLRYHLFRPFVTGNAGTGGSGLGLFVVRQAIRRMGGSICVMTSPAGTRVSLDLPSSDTEQAI